MEKVEQQDQKIRRYGSGRNGDWGSHVVVIDVLPVRDDAPLFRSHPS
jgi:hypothetical protein